MRIQYCIASLVTAGTERRGVLIANEAARRGHQVQLVVARAENALADLVDPAVEVVRLGVRGRFVPQGLPLLWRAISAFRPDLFHGLTNVGAFHGALLARLARVPAVVSSIGGLVPTITKSRIEARLAPWLMSGAQVITVNSQGVWDSFEGRFAGLKRRLALIPGSIDTAEWPCQDAALRAEARAELGLSPEQCAVVTVGRMVPEKNHADILTAAGALRDAYPQAVWVWVGIGRLHDELAQRAADLGLAERVRFLGLRYDLPRLHNGMDLFLLPSAFEGMSNALLEAMAAGLPAVVSDVAGSRELVEPGRTGWIVPPGEPQALAAALAEAFAEPARLPVMGRAGRALVEQRHGVQVVMDQYFALYDRLLAQRR